MPIQQSIARKQGRIQIHPEVDTPVGMRIFPSFRSASSRVGDVLNPGNPSYLTESGKDYNNRISSSGTSPDSNASNPGETFHNVATQPIYPIMVSVGQTQVVTQANTPEVMPHEKGTFFAKQELNVTPVRQSGGVAPNSDSAFHPIPMPVNRPRRYPTGAGERTDSDSFTSHHTLSSKPHNDVIGSRWSRIKRGAAETYMDRMTVFVPERTGFAVNNGIRMSTGNPTIEVNNQAHVGGGGFDGRMTPQNQPRPWIGQQNLTRLKSGGPLTSPNPFPLPLKCKKGNGC